jgi:NCS1 family nucleobase:cation symporter-1
VQTSPSQVNQPDLARYAKTRTSPLWSQLLALPIANTAVAW